jgi:hypothetical protein
MFTVQQSCAPVQHWPPQQVPPAAHGTAAPRKHGQLVAQLPPEQYGCAPPQTLPQVPQFEMSLPGLTQKPPQHLKPWQVASV